MGDKKQGSMGIVCTTNFRIQYSTYHTYVRTSSTHRNNSDGAALYHLGVISVRYDEAERSGDIYADFFF